MNITINQVTFKQRFDNIEKCLNYNDNVDSQDRNKIDI